MSNRNHVNWIEMSLLNETRNEIDVHYGRNKDRLENRKFYPRINWNFTCEIEILDINYGISYMNSCMHREYSNLPACHY